MCQDLTCCYECSSQLTPVIHHCCRLQAECSRVAASTRALIRSWCASAPATAAAALGTCTAALLDFAPAFSAISRPAGIKAVSRQLLSTQQAALLDHVVSPQDGTTTALPGLLARHMTWPALHVCSALLVECCTCDHHPFHDPQVGVLVSYGLTYSFPAEDSEHQLAPGYAAAPGQQLPRPAPLSPAVDTLHVYSTLGHSECDSRLVSAVRSNWRGKAMPLVLRQMMAQIISAENILRLDKVCRQQAGVYATPMYVDKPHSTGW